MSCGASSTALENVHAIQKLAIQIFYFWNEFRKHLI